MDCSILKQSILNKLERLEQTDLLKVIEFAVDIMESDQLEQLEQDIDTLIWSNK